MCSKVEVESAVDFLQLTVGVVGVLIARVLAAIGTIAAVLSNCKIEVERIAEKK